MRRAPTFGRGWVRSGGFFDYPAKAERLEEVTRELENPDVWNNPERAQDLGRERARLDTFVGGIDRLTRGFVDPEGGSKLLAGTGSV